MSQALYKAQRAVMINVFKFTFLVSDDGFCFSVAVVYYWHCCFFLYPLSFFFLLFAASAVESMIDAYKYHCSKISFDLDTGSFECMSLPKLTCSDKYYCDLDDKKVIGLSFIHKTSTTGCLPIIIYAK